MECGLCLSNFPDNLMELSHDVPKYLGGNDQSGRRYLCSRCHDIYENLILFRCIREILQEGCLPYLRNRNERIPFMIKIKELSPEKRKMCIKIALQINKRLFKKEDDSISKL